MKLIHDCVRDVMLDIEENLGTNTAIMITNIHSRISKYSFEDIYYTCQKLNEAGYLEVVFYLSGDGAVKNMTYDGHLFLDNIRDDSIWKETKSKVSKIASASLPIIQQVAAALIAAKLGI